MVRSSLKMKSLRNLNFAASENILTDKDVKAQPWVAAGSISFWLFI
tara:strand:+ start:450 stop:587 length:138 start_codon:yes stop_codon:yes gene_type:complete